MEQQRREFLATLMGAAAAQVLAGQTRQGDMIYRALGKTGERVSAIGLGGAHIGRGDPQKATQIIRSAIDGGITFMDNCWDYNNGNSELWMGQALRDGYRKKVFLMTKFDGRTKAKAAAQIDESLKRLQTDVIDLMQYHENIRMDDPDRFFAPSGPLEALLAAKKAGKIRFIGFTGHKDPAMHLHMFDMAAKNNFHFDTIQMPINILDASFKSFAHDVLPRAVAEGTAVLGMKPMAAGAIPQNGIAGAVDCLHYALTLPTSVVITGCDSQDRVKQALEAARTFTPLSETQISALLDKTREAASTGRFELFKTGTNFDGTSRNPQWMGV